MSTIGAFDQGSNRNGAKIGRVKGCRMSPSIERTRIPRHGRARPIAGISAATMILGVMLLVILLLGAMSSAGRAVEAQQSKDLAIKEQLFRDLAGRLRRLQGPTPAP